MRTYSFGDVSATFFHPGMGQHVVTGEGVGSISISMANDNTTHDVAADGSVMVTKIKSRNGTIAIQIQQTSPLNNFLMKWANYIEAAPSAEWARATIVISSRSTGEMITAVGVSPQKRTDKSYQQQGQQVTWNLMATDVQQDAA